MADINLTRTAEQQELAQVVRRFLDEKAPIEKVREWVDTDTGIDPAVWRQMAEQLALPGISVPEEHGGLGFGHAELCVVVEEMGRSLLSGPFFGTVVLGAQALTASGDRSAQERWLPGIAAGDTTATLAISEGRGPLIVPTTRATGTDADARVTGRKTLVVDGDSADLILVTALTDKGPGLFAVSGDAEGLSRRRNDTVDPTRRLAEIEFDSAPAVRVGSSDDSADLLTRIRALAVSALAAEQVGGANACLDSSVEYGKTRVQFGRPIGSFQAIKHRCADMLLDVEAARGAALYAAAAADQDRDEFTVSAAVAAAQAAVTYSRAAKSCIQIHGGIGFTWEHDAHLHLKRAVTGERLLGTPAMHRAHIADLVGISTGKAAS